MVQDRSCSPELIAHCLRAALLAVQTANERSKRPRQAGRAWRGDYFQFSLGRGLRTDPQTQNRLEPASD